MKLKILANIEEGELFFAYVNTVDGKDLRSYIKGPLIKDMGRTCYFCEHTSGDSYMAKMFSSDKELVWA